MKFSVKLLAALTCASAVAVAPVGAQEDACSPNQNSPQFAGRAFISVQKGIAALNAQGSPVADARSAVRLLTDPAARDRAQNAAGQAYTLGQALALILSQTSVPTTGTRADFGFATNGEQPADLLVIADSVFTEAARLLPECAMQIGAWRQGPAWVATMNAALSALNENKLDTAEVLARRALLLDRTAPYAHVVLGGVARQRLDAAPAANKAALYADARTHLTKALEIARADTSYADVARSANYELGDLIAASVPSAPPSERAARAREAAEYLKRYAEMAESDVQRADAIMRMAGAYEAINDTAAIRAVYAPVASDAARYGERSLLAAGVLATRFGNASEAAAFFNAVLKTNPYHRDALRNLSVTMVKLNDFAGLLPITQRLTALDPNNPENWIFHAYAYAGMAEKAKSAQLRRAYTDSSTKYDRLSTTMPVRVTFTEFTPGDTETRLRGTIENLGTTPKTYTLVVEMLDRSGNVVATEQAEVGPVAPNGTGTFNVTGKAAGVIAYRYKPLL